MFFFCYMDVAAVLVVGWLGQTVLHDAGLSLPESALMALLVAFPSSLLLLLVLLSPSLQPVWLLLVLGQTVLHGVGVRGTPYAPDARLSSASASDSRLPSAPTPATSSLFRNAFG